MLVVADPVPLLAFPACNVFGEFVRASLRIMPDMIFRWVLK